MVDLDDRHDEHVSRRQRVDRHEADGAVVAPDERAGQLAVDDAGEDGRHAATLESTLMGARIDAAAVARRRSGDATDPHHPQPVHAAAPGVPAAVPLPPARTRQPGRRRVAARRPRRDRLGRRLPRPPPRAGQRVRQGVRPDRRPPAVHRRPVRHHHRRRGAAVVLLGDRHPRGARRGDDGGRHAGVPHAPHRRQLVGQAGHVPADVRRSRVPARRQRLSREHRIPGRRMDPRDPRSCTVVGHRRRLRATGPRRHRRRPERLSEHVAVRYVGAP